VRDAFDDGLPPSAERDHLTKSSGHLAIETNLSRCDHAQAVELLVDGVSGGVELVNSSIFGQTADPDLAPTLDSLVGDENSFMYNYGGGIRFFGSEKAGFRIDARQVRYESSARGRQDHIEIGFALTLILGGA